MAGVLYLFRKIYGEVVTALPLNGGAYNVLLNTTTKAKASVAACLTLLSYVATAVISSNEAMHYAGNLWQGLDVYWATVAVLGLFALLNVVGINESAVVALGIFTVHMTTLTVLVVTSGLAVMKDPSGLVMNWQTPPPGGMLSSVFFGFAVAMLGISGFESSANFVEEQKDGVFLKTLRNMWWAVAIFNPLISFLALGLIPLDQMEAHKQDLLAEMGMLSAGAWLQHWVSADAVLVLCGAVVTSYVGVTGLVRRMSLDRCLPQFLLLENQRFRTNHWIIGLFFFLCCSILTLTAGRIETLAGVYTLSFLGVMALFAVGNMLLKTKRAELPRAVRAGWGGVAAALVAVLVGLVGNVLLNPAYLQVFSLYFVVTVAAVGLMFERVRILKVALLASKAIAERVLSVNRRLTDWTVRRISEINSQAAIFFASGCDITELNAAALYVLNNEQTTRLKVVHCYEREEEIPPQLAEHLKTLDHIYPQLRIDLVLVKGEFGPELIERLSRRLGVPKNYMFIGTPGNEFPHKLSELGGVRLIM